MRVNTSFVDAQFSDDMADWGNKIYDSLRTEDPVEDDDIMPPLDAPGGKLWKDRDPEDPVVELDRMLTAWYEQGRPAEYFYVDQAESERKFCWSTATANQLTNIGSCIPDPSEMSTAKYAMKGRDDFFARTEKLPDTLSDTDLVSFDSSILATSGVVSFAPGYPLFSDDEYEPVTAKEWAEQSGWAGDAQAAADLGKASLRKVRHVRVPLGQKIEFNKDLQEFAIPENTRFYKTFLKKVIGLDGLPYYRKIETRIIVTRADGPQQNDGSHETHALFGVYAWDENETQAYLVTDPKRDGGPFLDRVVTYVTDERAQEEFLQMRPDAKLQEQLERGIVRNYAMPGSVRCVQCHMGSPSRDFVLGFNPLQIARREPGSGGTYEDSGPDELGQLQRLIDYGVISGVDAPEDVLTLEESQGSDRPPRNEHELKAQGYMLGNCANCHNPRGYPSVINPQLREVLNFFPSADREGKRGGGIFQFPYEQASPRIKRLGKPMQYLHSALTDGTGEVLDGRVGFLYTSTRPGSNPDELEFRQEYVAAPWRSLLYRVVDTPFLSVQGDLMLPHMPMNAPGFDRRAPQILGKWALSVPTRRAPGVKLAEEQYEEVLSTDPDYETAVIRAETRVRFYTEGGDVTEDDYTYGESFQYYSPFRYQHYDVDSSNIIYYRPQSAKSELPPDRTPLPSIAQSCPTTPPDTDTLCQYAVSGGAADGLPDQPNWVVTDFTDFPGDWAPRRADWPDAVLHKEVKVEEGAGAAVVEARGRERKALEILSEINITQEAEFREFATTPVPFGLWEQKPGCNFESVPKAEEFMGVGERPSWFDHEDFPVDKDPPKPSDPIFMMSPGAMVYNQICINCHGPQMDSQGRLSDNLMLLTGGNTRVANFVHGLLGPVADEDPQTKPGDNREREFGDEALAEGSGLKADDLAARYFAWMALGGTRSIIEQGLLGIVLTTDVLGEPREIPNTAVQDANMLEVARLLCGLMLDRNVDPTKSSETRNNSLRLNPHTGKLVFISGLIGSNGDAETWLKLCSAPLVHRGRNQEGVSSPALQPIRVFRVSQAEAATGEGLPGIEAIGRPETYPRTRAIGDHRGGVQDNLTPDNLFPWCVRPADSEATLRVFNEVNKARALAGLPPLPICPQSWYGNAQLGQMVEENVLSTAEETEWALRGAAAAGLAAFEHVTTLAKDLDEGKPVPLLYNQCERLP